MNETDNKGRHAPFETAGRRIDDEVEKLISYLNDEVVPSVRKHSTEGLRIAAEKLNWLADYMDQRQSPGAAAKSEDREP